MGLFGPPNVEKMKAKRDVKGLIQALGYQKGSNVRRGAAVALGAARYELSQPKPGPGMIAWYTDRSGDSTFDREELDRWEPDLTLFVLPLFELG